MPESTAPERQPRKAGENSLDRALPKYQPLAKLLIGSFADLHSTLLENPIFEDSGFEVHEDLEPKEVPTGFDMEKREGALFVDILKDLDDPNIAPIGYRNQQKRLEKDVDLFPDNVLLRGALVVLEPDQPKFRISVWGDMNAKEAEKVADKFIPARGGMSRLEIDAKGKKIEDLEKRLFAIYSLIEPNVVERAKLITETSKITV